MEPRRGGRRPSHVTEDLPPARDLDAHPTHDPLLIAALAAGDAPEADRVAAQEIVMTCRACAALHDDLVVLSRATAQLPPPIRTRDYRLDPASVARLRSPWRRFLDRVGDATAGMRRPLATGLTTLGIVGFLLSGYGSGQQTILSTIGGPVGPSAGGDYATEQAKGTDDGRIAAPAASAAAQPGSTALPSGLPAPAPGDVSTERDGTLAAGGDATSETEAPPIAWLPLVWIALLTLGLGLFALSRLERRG
jgi:hypothetical protein